MRGLKLNAPVGQVKDGHALVLDNWICRDDGLHVREGWSPYRLGLPGAVTRIIPQGDAAHRKVYAATANAIYDVWTPVLTSLANGNWHSVRMVNAAGQFSVAANGADGLFVSDGVTASIKTLGGLAAAKYDRVHWHHHRLWLAGNDLEPHYLDMDAVQGTAHPFPLTQNCRKGGRVVAMATITKDGGRSSNDELAFVTSEGELLIYGGNDPDNAGSFGIVGVWDVGKPRGPRCFAEDGGEVVLLTERGLLQIPSATNAPQRQIGQAAVSDAIEPLLSKRWAQTASGEWEVVASAEHGFLLISDGTYSYCRSDTDGWSRFVGIPGKSWTEFDGELLFATGTTVAKYGGHMDRDQPIPSCMVEAFSRLGASQYKTARRFRPHYKALHPYLPRVELLTDEREPLDPFAAANLDDVHHVWPDLDWPDTPIAWEQAMSSRVNLWRSVNGRGFTMAAAIGMKTRAPLIYTGHDITYELGGMHP